jgi:membrane fusion protein, heavy metal efflux system
MSYPARATLALCSAALWTFCGCGNGKADPAAEAPPPAQVVQEPDLSVVQVQDAGQFPLSTATEYDAAPQLVVNGIVNPDVSRTVPVVTLVSGRVVDVRARLGDTVRKGQVLLRIRSSDVAQGYSDYRKAVSDELLARTQLGRANDLYAHGVIAEKDLEAARNAEDDAKATLDSATEHLQLYGTDPDHPSGVVDIPAPVSGVITDQEVTEGSSVQSYSANPFTISDLSQVWVVCDVYENDLPNVRLGEMAEIRLSAYPDRVLKGIVSNIGAILDPAIRTAKVRVQVENPGFLRVGMFAAATFYGLKKTAYAAVPASAILHLRDHDWVFVPAGNNQFQRTEVSAGATLPNQMQEVLSGLQPGRRVVANALALQNTVDNE